MRTKLLFSLCFSLLPVSIFSAPPPAPNNFIENHFIKVGINPEAGGVINYLAPAGSGHSLVNTHDLGRNIQQSYYGGPDGSTWGGKPWTWNPVQGGSTTGQRAKLLDFRNDGRTLYAKTIPKHWATGADVSEMTMEEWITLDNQIVHVHYRMHYEGRTSHPPAEQEMPAVFLDHRLITLAYYKGPTPWTGAPLTRGKPADKNQYDDITENWAAYLNESDWGVGVYVPEVSQITYYVIRDDKNGCAYLAPIKKFAIAPGLTLDYDVYLRIGSVQEIRNAFYKIHSQPQRRHTPLSPSR